MVNNNNKKQKFSLVLSGGGIWGCAHVGVLKYLEEKNLKPNEIIGTSFGAIIGASYSLGHNEKMIENILKVFSKKNWIQFNWKKSNSILSMNTIEKDLKIVFGNKTFKDTQIPLKIIATNFNTGTPTCFSKENEPNMKILDAILCSIAIPAILETKNYKNIPYVDGGISSNLPIEFSSNKKIIAVDVMSDKGYKIKQTNMKILHKLDYLLKQTEKSMLITIYSQTQAKLKSFKGNIILLKPDVIEGHISSLNNWEKLVEFGYKEAKIKLN